MSQLTEKLELLAPNFEELFLKAPFRLRELITFLETIEGVIQELTPAATVTEYEALLNEAVYDWADAKWHWIQAADTAFSKNAVTKFLVNGVTIRFVANLLIHESAQILAEKVK